MLQWPYPLNCTPQFINQQSFTENSQRILLLRLFLLSIFIEVIYQIARVNPCDNLSTNSSEIGSHRRGSLSNCTGKPMWQFINQLFRDWFPPTWFSYQYCTDSHRRGSHRRGSPISIVLILTDVVPTDVVLLSVLYWSHSSNCTGKPMWQFINHLFQCTPPKWVLGYLFSYEAMSLKTLTSRHWSRLRSHSFLSMLISYRCHPFYKCCTSKNILHVHQFCPVSCSFKTTPETGFVVISTDQQRLFSFSYEAMSLKTLTTYSRHWSRWCEVALIFIDA